MAPVRSVRAVGTAGLGARWRRDNRPDFPGIAVWVDAVAEIEAEIEIDAEAFGGGEGFGDGEAGSEGFEAAGGEAGGLGRAGAEGFGAAGGEGFGGGVGWPGSGGFETVGEGGDWADADADADTDTEDWRGGSCEDTADGESVPWAVDAWSPEYGKVWLPLSGSGREPRPGLLLSVVRAGPVVAYPTPLPDPPTGVLARALARLERPEQGRPHVLAVAEVEAVSPPGRMASQKPHREVRALVGVLVEILVGRRAATHAAGWTDPEVRGKLRTPRYARTASLKSVRLSESGDGVEALALLRDGSRTRAIALRFDRAEDSRWCCTALQTG